MAWWVILWAPAILIAILNTIGDLTHPWAANSAPGPGIPRRLQAMTRRGSTTSSRRRKRTESKWRFLADDIRSRRTPAFTRSSSASPSCGRTPRSEVRVPGPSLITAITSRGWAWPGSTPAPPSAPAVRVTPSSAVLTRSWGRTDTGPVTTRPGPACPGGCTRRNSAVRLTRTGTRPRCTIGSQTSPPSTRTSATSWCSRGAGTRGWWRGRGTRTLRGQTRTGNTDRDKI